MIQIEARNARTGVVVCTFGAAEDAFGFCRDRKDLGELEVFAVETIRRERLLTEAPAIPLRGQRVGR